MNKYLKFVKTLNMANMDVDMAPITTKQIIQCDNIDDGLTKKSRATSHVSTHEVEGFKWWLEFSTIQAIVQDKRLLVCLETSPIVDLVIFGRKEEEAKENITATLAYGRVPQIF
jgi:hypothetical protein